MRGKYLESYPKMGNSVFLWGEGWGGGGATLHSNISFFFFMYYFYLFVCLFFFLGPQLQHVEVPRLGV